MVIIGVYTKEKIINTYPPLFIQAHRNGAVGLDFCRFGAMLVSVYKGCIPTIYPQLILRRKEPGSGGDAPGLCIICCLNIL